MHACLTSRSPTTAVVVVREPNQGPHLVTPSVGDSWNRSDRLLSSARMHAARPHMAAIWSAFFFDWSVIQGLAPWGACVWSCKCGCVWTGATWAGVGASRG